MTWWIATIVIFAVSIGIIAIILLAIICRYSLGFERDTSKKGINNNVRPNK